MVDQIMGSHCLPDERGPSSLSQAIGDKDVATVEQLLRSGQCSPDANNEEKLPPVIECIVGKDSVVRDSPLPPEEDQDEEDVKRSQLLKVLLENGADLHARSDCEVCGRHFGNVGTMAVMCSVERGYLRCLDILVVFGANLNITTERGDTTLIDAVKRSGMAAGGVKYLAEHVWSSILNHRDKYGRTALMWASTFSTDEKLGCMQALIDAGADLQQGNSSGRNALMLSLETQNLAATELLLGRGAELEARDGDGRTALMYAVQFPDTGGLTLLLGTGAELEARDRDGQTALMLAVRFQNVAAVALLLDRGAELEATDEDGHTPLILAVRSGHCDMVAFLLERGASPNAVTRSGETALKFAIDDSCESIAIMLLHHGVDPTSSPQHRDLLHNTVSCGRDAVTRALVMNGFPPLDVRLVYFKSPLVGPTVWNRDAEYRQQVKCYLETTALSPLAVALLCCKRDTARYFILNRFLTHFDIMRLCWDRELRMLLQAIKAWESLEVLDLLSARPQSLVNLSLVAVSSALSQPVSSALSQPITRTSRHKDCSEKDATLLKNTTFSFRDKVTHLDKLPPCYHRALLHQTSFSAIPCPSWGDFFPREEGQGRLDEASVLDRRDMGHLDEASVLERKDRGV